MHEMQDLEKGN